jgi:hypothetical protein
VSWNPETIPRTTFASKTHWDAVTIFKEPIKKVGTLTVSVVDNNGDIIDNNSTDITFLTLKFYCQTHTPIPKSPPPPPQIEAPEPEKYMEQPKKVNYMMYIILAILLGLGAKFFMMR